MLPAINTRTSVTLDRKRSEQLVRASSRSMREQRIAEELWTQIKGRCHHQAEQADRLHLVVGMRGGEVDTRNVRAPVLCHTR